MNRLEFNFDCLDGHYFCAVEENTYTIETDIPCFENKNGGPTDEEKENFFSKIDEAKIESRDRHYLPEGEGIEDSVNGK